MKWRRKGEKDSRTEYGKKNGSREGWLEAKQNYSLRVSFF